MVSGLHNNKPECGLYMNYTPVPTGVLATILLSPCKIMCIIFVSFCFFVLVTFKYLWLKILLSLYLYLGD